MSLVTAVYPLGNGGVCPAAEVAAVPTPTMVGSVIG
jgi:hypothetical protein